VHYVHLAFGDFHFNRVLQHSERFWEVLGLK